MSFREGTRGYGPPERVAISGTSAQSSALNYNEIMMHNADTATCYVLFGSSPTSTVAGGLPLAAGEKLHVRFKPGNKVAVIGAANSNYLYICGVTES